MSVFVDTSALLAILDEADARHLEARATFQELLATVELATHNYVHVEADALVTRRLGRAVALRLVDDLLPAMTTVWVDEALHRAALAAMRSDPHRASLVDQVSFEVMRRQGIRVAFTFDADFDRQGFERPPAGETRQSTRLSEAVEPYGGPPAASDLVSVAEIAARSGHPANTVQSWRRRRSDFPAPAATLAAGPVWLWPEVARWVAARADR